MVMRIVDKALLSDLIEGSLEQKVGHTPTSAIPSLPVIKPCMEYVDHSYKKGHKVPEGLYWVRIVDIRCHGPYAYKMQIEILEYAGNIKNHIEPQIIIGYCRRYGTDFKDLAMCFGTGEIHKKSTGYKGSCGVISLSHSGWVTLIPRDVMQNKHL